jgi:hypothetical protein
MLYEDIYCRRGCMENHIKSWKTHLAADRTSCSKAAANQFRLFRMPAPIAAVGVARCHAETLGLAGGAIRSPAAPARQNRCARGGDEDANPAAFAIGLSVSDDPRTALGRLPCFVT